MSPPSVFVRLSVKQQRVTPRDDRSILLAGRDGDDAAVSPRTRISQHVRALDTLLRYDIPRSPPLPLVVSPVVDAFFFSYIDTID